MGRQDNYRRANETFESGYTIRGIKLTLGAWGRYMDRATDREMSLNEYLEWLSHILPRPSNHLTDND